MTLTELVGRLLGVERAEAMEWPRFSLAAPWAHDAPAWLLFGCLGLAAVAIVFYTRYQPGRRFGARVLLGVCRAAVLGLLLLVLAEPVATITTTSRLRPALWLLFDGTDSMAVADQLSEAERTRLAEATGLKKPDGSPDGGTTASAGVPRIDYVRALLRSDRENIVEKLQERFRLKAFLFDRAEGVRALELAAESEKGPDGAHLAEQLTTEGQVTALGAALEDLARRHATSNLAGVVVVSDFNQNAGPPAPEAADRLGVKVYTLGVGPISAVDVAVDLQAQPLMKKDERITLTATLHQEGLTGAAVTVNFTSQRLGGTGGPALAAPVGQQTVKLTRPTQIVEMPYIPKETGRFVFAASVDPQEGEVVDQNNRSQREATVRDDFLRLLFVEYEPTWEWRFVKEVFHRDKLVGMRGFRTFLRSADPKVRETNPLFQTTMSPPRSQFFAHDVVFLGDMPASALSPQFCRLTKEFVGKFGGGLVVMAGPRFGPGQLADTPLDELLPVKVDPKARVRDRKAFRLALAPEAAQYDFMQLGANEPENRKAWDNMGLLPWYQPVEKLRPLATALAVHPSDTCIDGKTPQPLIAVTKYERGEVIYLAFDETWRLRRKYGERYYRQFWGQMIHRLALRHALGSEKRFVVRTDRPRYRPDDRALLTVEAYDADFKPMKQEDVPGRRLDAELVPPWSGRGEPPKVQPLSVAQLREGIFEARIPVFAAGQYRVRVKDPITKEYTETSFKVESLSVERQQAVRQVVLQKMIAETTGGRAADLADAASLVDQIDLPTKTETSIEVISLWDTWLAFGCVVLLMLGEWLGRKWVNLP
jgi:hypothetical protein